MVARIGFRTQRLLLGRYLVDILVNQAPIVIEADGMIHTHPRTEPRTRDAMLTSSRPDTGCSGSPARRSTPTPWPASRG